MSARIAQQVEHNVKYVFIFTVAYWSASSMITQQVLAGYIFVLMRSNKPVGMVKGIQGICQLLCALPAGFAADLIRRDRLLGLAGVVGIASSLLTALAFELASIKLIYAAFALAGVFTGMQNPAMEALFADSVPAGRRSLPFTLKHMLKNTAMALGPLVTILLFDHYGDRWELTIMRAIVLVGSVATCASMLVLFRFDDDQAYENKQRVLAVEGHLRSLDREFDDVELSTCSDLDAIRPAEHAESTEVCATTVTTPRAPSEHSSLLLTESGATEFTFYTNTAVEDTSIAQPQPNLQKSSRWCGVEPEHVPYLLFLSDFMVSNGTGMTVSFFPLFFFQEFGLTPIQVNVMLVLQPFTITLLSFLGQLLSRWSGRMPVNVATRLCGTGCLMLMSLTTSLRAACVFFVLRATMMRCSEPLRRSLLMDFVPKNQRARWNSLEALCMASRSGSAIVGGLIVDAHGYRFCFFIASFVYLAGVIFDLLLIPICGAADSAEPDDSVQKKAAPMATS